MAVPPTSFVPSNQAQEILNAGIQHHRSGRLAEAEAAYRKVLSIKSDHPDALHLLGIIAGSTGHITPAIDLITQATIAFPNQPLYYNTLSDFLRQGKRYDESLAAANTAIQLKPGFAEAYNNMGVTLSEMKRADEAIIAFRHAVHHAPQFPDAHNNLSATLREAGYADEAVSEARKTIAILPGNPLFHFNLGLALVARKQQDQAILAYRQAVALRPDFLDAYYAMGLAHMELRQFDEALAAYEHVVRLNPKHAEMWNSAGVARWHQGSLQGAIDAFNRAIESNPQFPSAHYNLGTLLLLKGDFEKGWDGYEWRWGTTSQFFPARDFPKPQWDGSSLAGRTILLHVEQGYGDSIQFIRYAPIIKAMGARIVLGCQPSLFKLFGKGLEIDQLVQEVNDKVQYDVHCPLLSLPRVLKTRVDSIPAKVPYIHADPELVKLWESKVKFPQDRLKVGLVCSGSKTLEADRYRSISISQFGPLAKVKNVVFYSLQKGAGTYQAADVPAGMEIIDLGPDIQDFTDTAAIISKLDLVITVDTAVAHLAGAMGRPTWILIRSYLPEWRWMLDRADTPWYPTARLFRQTTPGDWTQAIANVASELEKM